MAGPGNVSSMAHVSPSRSLLLAHPADEAISSTLENGDGLATSDDVVQRDDMESAEEGENGLSGDNDLETRENKGKVFR